ncbi:MAG: hypothetical protein LBI48_08845 [Burkholderiaceae bacterium]|nr:hypothetical protein [Burkholderiaceae bacterium]
MVDALAALGVQAARLLCDGDFSALAKNFGYLLKFERDPASALQTDLLRCLSDLQASCLNAASLPEPRVSYFQPNEQPGLFALVEQDIPTDNNKYVLLELVVMGWEPEKHIYIEDISV